MKLHVASLLLVLLLPTISLGQEQRTNSPPERKSIDWFYEDANSHSQTLLLKLLQFQAPYPGYYQQTVVEANGNAFSARNVPDWAIQGAVSAKLDPALMVQIKQLLGQLNVPTVTTALEQPGQLHSAVVFYDGHNYLRLNYNGPNPTQIDAILALLHEAFTTAERARMEETTAAQKLLREKYGNWENRAGVTKITSGQMQSCKGDALLLLTAGERKSAGTNSPAPVSLYHALVFYPRAGVIGAGSGGRRTEDPVQSYVVMWSLPNAEKTFPADGTQPKFEILHNAIDATVTIAGKTYRLTDGNMFVVRLDAHWLANVTQLNEVFEEQTTASASLDRFKAVLKNDATIQKLELDGPPR